MTNVQRITGLISSAILAIINACVGAGVALPTGVDAKGVFLVNAAVLAIAAAVLHLMGKDQSAQPPVA